MFRMSQGDINVCAAHDEKSQEIKLPVLLCSLCEFERKTEEKKAELQNHKWLKIEAAACLFLIHSTEGEKTQQTEAAERAGVCKQKSILHKKTYEKWSTEILEIKLFVRGWTSAAARLQTFNLIDTLSLNVHHASVSLKWSLLQPDVVQTPEDEVLKLIYEPECEEMKSVSV